MTVCVCVYCRLRKAKIEYFELSLVHTYPGRQVVVEIKLFLREGITKCLNKVYNKFTNIRQHNNYVLDHIGYMFRPVNKSSSGLQ